MNNPPRFLIRLARITILITMAGMAGCTFYGKEGMTRPLPLLPASPLVVASPTPAPPNPAPDETLYDPLFEEVSAVVAWARPLAPENSFNAQFTPDGQHLLYLSRHPGTRWTSLYSVPVAGGEPVLLGTGNAPEEIFYYTSTSDSKRVIYYQPFSGRGLYSSTLLGTKEVELTDARVSEVVISPDGQWVVYWTDEERKREKEQETDKERAQRSALYSVPIGGGTSIRLGDGLPSTGSYQITPDSRYVIFRSAPELSNATSTHLIRVPIQGGTPLQLNQGKDFRSFHTFFIAPDSQSIFYGNLFRVSIDGGAPEQLNPMPSASEHPFPFSTTPQLSPDGQWLIFLSGIQREIPVDLLALSLAEGAMEDDGARRLSAPLAPGENVQSFLINKDGQSVSFWLGGDDSSSSASGYSVAIAGGAPTLLPVQSWTQQSADGRWVVYGAPREQGGNDIFAMPAQGGTPITLTTTVPTSSGPAWSTISPDSRHVFYVTSKDPGGGMPVFNGLYRVPIEGGEAREITGVDGQDRVFGYFPTPDGSGLIANVDYDGDGRAALYWYVLAALPPPPE